MAYVDAYGRTLRKAPATVAKPMTGILSTPRTGATLGQNVTGASTGGTKTGILAPTAFNTTGVAAPSTRTAQPLTPQGLATMSLPAIGNTATQLTAPGRPAPAGAAVAANQLNTTGMTAPTTRTAQPLTPEQLATMQLGGSPGTGPAAPGTGILSGLLGGNNQPDMETTGSVVNEPWKPTQPYLTGILSDAQQIYDQQNGLWNKNTAQGENMINTMANQTNGIVNQALGTTNAIADGSARLNTEGDYRGILAQAQQPGAAEQYLTRTASGDYLNNGDPYLDTIINTANDKARTQLQDVYSGAGRYGGATMNRDIADTTYANEAGTRSANYQAERDRQMQAANSIEGAQQGRIGLQGNVVNGITGVQQQNTQNRLNASSMLPALADARFIGADRLMALGDYQANRPWQQINNYADLIGGISGQGGTSTTSQPEEPFWKKLLGAVSGGLGIWGSLSG